MLYSAQWIISEATFAKSWAIKHSNELYLEPYKKAHVNHPTCKWIRQHSNNYIYSCNLALSLCKEYTRRYLKTHACEKRIHWLLENIPLIDNLNQIPIDHYLAIECIPTGCTPVPLAMPQEFHCPNLIRAYRSYYISNKKKIAQTLEAWEKLAKQFKIVIVK